MRKWIALAAGLVVLIIANYTIYHKEQLLANSRMILLELAPVDPRSLIQGDYMALRFKIANAIGGNGKSYPMNGCLVLRLDTQGIGSFVRFDDHTPLEANDVRLSYHVRNGRINFATNAFFFQEGNGQRYQSARYGELRVNEDGDAILTGLRNQDLAPL